VGRDSYGSLITVSFMHFWYLYKIFTFTDLSSSWEIEDTYV